MKHPGLIILAIFLLALAGLTYIFSPSLTDFSNPLAWIFEPAKPKTPSFIPGPLQARDDAIESLIETCKRIPKPFSIGGQSYYKRYAGRVGSTSVFRLIDTTNLSRCFAYTVETTAYTDTKTYDILYVRGL